MPQNRTEFGQIQTSHFENRLRKSTSLSQRLDKLEEHSVCIVLDKGVEKLRTVRKLLPEPEVIGHEPYKGIISRMTTLQKIKPPEDQENGTEFLKHIQKCCFMSQEALEKMIQGFKSGEGMLPCLKYIVFLENLKYYDDFLLKQEHVNLTDTICNLNENINEVNKQYVETRLYMDKMTQICLQQADVTAWAQCKTLKRNNDYHQHARVDQNTYRIKGKEDSLSDLREQCESNISRESIVNNEITSHLQMVITSLQKKIEKWTASYSEEIDTLDIALLQLRSNIDELQERFNLVTQQHAVKQEMVESLHTEADERDREQEIRLVQIKAAIIIQHWWRELLVRRGKMVKKVPTSRHRAKSKTATASTASRKNKRVSTKKKNK